jgi:hypothetical protein
LKEEKKKIRIRRRYWLGFQKRKKWTSMIVAAAVLIKLQEQMKKGAHLHFLRRLFLILIFFSEFIFLSFS